jgi:CRISPR-associated exonuclease Cas4
METLPLSALNDFLYCPRRAALKLIEGWRSENEHTVLGDIGHEHTDLPGYEVAKGVKLLRALPVFSERLGLSGKCDIVEVRGGTSNDQCSIANDQSQITIRQSLFPVEYKKGKRRQFDNDDAQLCAQALCLEEMFSCKIEHGAIFHAASKRRREVEFTPELRALTERAVADLRALTESGTVPPARFEPRCEECSLYEICLPRLTDAESARRVQRFQKELWSA